MGRRKPGVRIRARSAAVAKRRARAAVGEALEPRVFLAAHILGSATVYPTIQAAVTAATPASVITVDAGSYPELVTVNKTLTIRGAQAGVDARSNARQTGTGESVVSGAAVGGGVSSGFYITANDVTIDGFTVQGNTSPSQYGAGIVMAPSIAGTHVFNNVIQNNIAGLFLANSSTTDPAIIQYNVFSHNNNAGDNGGRGIYTDGGIAGPVLTNVTIDSNFFFRNLGGNGTTGVEAAVALESRSVTPTLDVRITNNTFDGNGKAVLAYDAGNLTITGNTITNSQDADSGALRFEGGINNVAVQNNNIYNNLAPAVRIDAKGFTGNSSSISLTNNNIYGNGYVDIATPPPGIQVGSVIVAAGTYNGSFNVSGNWWGSASGPGGDGPGTGDILRVNGGSVDFSGFKAAPIALPQQTPFTGLAAIPDSQIQAVTFDQGGPNLGYQVGGNVNPNMNYRATAVQTETTADAGSAYDVAYDATGFLAGQWLAYTIRVPLTGTYRLDTRVASAVAGGTFHYTIDGSSVGGTRTVPNTGGAQVWQTVSTTNFSVTAGQHVLKLLFDTNGAGGTVGSFHWLQLVTVSANAVVPAAPTNLAAIPVATSQIDLTWTDAAANETGFTIERSTNGTTFTTLATVGAGVTSYADTGLAPATQYYYQVKATNGVGASPASNVASATTLAPAAVTQLSDLAWVSATSGFLTVQRDLSVRSNPITLRGTVYPKGLGTHAVSQIVYSLGGAYSAFTSDVGIDDEVASGGSVVFQVLGDGGAVLYTSAVLTRASAVVHVNINVTGVQQLTLVVNDGNGDITSDHADWAAAQLLTGAPPAPTNLQASAGNNQVTLTWTASSGAASYNIYRGTTAGGEAPTPIATGVTATTFTNTGLTAGTTYYYKVAAVNAVGEGAKSAEAFAVASQAPSVPTGLTASGNVNQIKLAWAAASGASSYNIYRGTTAGGEAATALATGVTALTFADSGLASQATYFYKITAVNGVGESAKSAEVSATVLQPPAHIVIVVEENESGSAIIGNAQAAYINSLAQNGALFTNSHGVTHPSQPNYLAMFSGSTQGVTTNDIPPSLFAGPDLASSLIAAGLSFGGYADGLPAVGSLVETAGNYARKHNPWADFADVPTALNMPFTMFPTNFDLLPTVSFVVPDLVNDMHDGTIQQGDTWLQTNLGAFATWAKTHNSLLVVTWDEDDGTTATNQIPTIFYGQQVKTGSNNQNIDHYSLLRTVEDLYGLPRLGASATASVIQDSWQSVLQPPPTPVNVQATPSPGQIALSWPISVGAAGYKIYRGTTAGGEGATAFATGVGSNAYTDSTVTGGLTYYYQVTAVNAAGESLRSTEISSTAVKATPAFSALTASSSVAYGTSSVTLGGTLSAGALIPTGNVTITINGVSTPAAINASTGAFSASFDTHALPASATAYTVTYAYAGNATFNPASDASRTLTVTTRALHVTATGVNRAYDGTTAGTVTLQDDRANADVLTLTYASAVFANKNVGTGKALSVTGIALSGAGASNYTLANTTAGATANITQRVLTFTATGVNRIYDATTAATVTYADNRVAGDVLAFSATSVTFADKNVGTAKPITVTGVSISGTDAGNYSLAATTASASANITVRSLTVTATGVNKVYDGTTAATVTFADNRAAGDTLTATSAAPTFANKNVGTAKAISITGIAISGADAANYSLTAATASATANITARSLTVTATGANKVYDRTTAATVTLADNRVAGDLLTTSSAPATFADKNVGTAKPVSVTGITVGGADAANYSLTATTASTTANITALTITGAVTAASKVYDGTTAASLLTRTLTGVLGADVVSLTGGTATFDTKAVGTAKTVTATSLSLTGADAGNYALASTTATTTANVTALSITGNVTASNKVYDGTTAASLLTRTLTGVLGADAVTLTGGAATFDTKNVASGKTVTATGLSLSGADAGNYTLASTTATTTANVTAATITGSVTASNKAYDGTAAATLLTRTLTGVLGADVVSLTGGTATFNTKNVGTGKAVTATGLSLSGADAGNYALASTTATTTANVTALTISASVTASSKTYDGSTAASLLTRTLTGVIGADVVSLTGGTATFDTKAVGTAKNVTATTLSLTGADAGNYALSSTTATTTADVTALSITGSVTASNKVYDGTTAASLLTRSLGGVLGADAVTLTGGTATFDSKAVGTGKTVSATGLGLAGADSGNYSLSSTTATTTADVTALAITGFVTAANKVYDGTTAATILTRTLAGVLGADAVTLTGGTAAFDTRNAAGGKTVTATGLALAGADAGNYILSSTTATTTADITPLSINAGVTASSRVYDGTTAASLLTRTPLGVIGSDAVALTGGTATFDTRNVGTGKTVTATGLALAGADAGNYTLSSTTATTTADVTPLAISAAVTASNKTYDATTAATLVTRTLTGVLGADAVSLTGGTASFDTKLVANGKTVTATGLALAGADAANYALANTTATTTADITPLGLTASVTASNKVYDGTTAAAVLTRSVAGVLGTDDVTLAGGIGTFDTKSVGVAKNVTVAGLTLAGADAGNYALVSTTATTSADVTPLAVTGAVTASSKVYDGTTAAAIATRSLTGALAGDAVSLSGGTATFDTRNVGTGKLVTATGLSLAGADAANYTLASSSATTTANVTQLSISGNVTASNKTYDGTTAVTLLTRTLTGVLGADAVSLVGGAATFGTKNAGTAKAVTATGLALAGADAGNYVLIGTTASTTADVAPLSITAGVTAQNKPYDGTPAATIATRTLTGVLGADAVSLAGGTAAFDDKNVGAAKTVTATGLSLSGADAGNYALASTTATTTADITPQRLIPGTIGDDAITLVLDASGLHVDWFLDGPTPAFGQLLASDALGLTIQGNGGNDAVTLDYARGGPLPANLRLDADAGGKFTVIGLQGASPFAGTTIDVGRSTVYFAYTGAPSDPFAAIQSALQAGYAGGTWAGAAGGGGAIVSSAARNNPLHNTAVGYADFGDGSGANTVAGTVLLKYAVVGDVDLDGAVGLADYTAVVRNFGTGDRWTLGAVTYGGVVGLSDYTAVVRNFGTSVPAAAPAIAPAAAAATSTTTATPISTPVVSASVGTSPSTSATTPPAATLEDDGLLPHAKRRPQPRSPRR